MADINGISGINSLLDDLGIDKTKNTEKSELGQAEFFELMVAQMKNQDPLKPESNGDFLAQLAQFKTSDGITNMQSSLDSLTSSMQSNQALQASSLVGRSVLVPGDQATLAAGGSVDGVVTLEAAAQNLTLDIYASSGSLVKQVPLGTHGQGDLNFNWDGTDNNNAPMPAGNYKMVVNGTVGGESFQFPTHIAANVDSVTLGNNGQGMKLNIAGVGSLSLSDVKQIGK